MTEQKMTYVGGANDDDYFAELNDVLLGLSGVFTVAVMSRGFTGFPTPRAARITHISSS